MPNDKDGRKARILANIPTTNNQDRLVNGITGERDSGRDTSITPSNVTFFSDFDTQKSFNDVADVGEYNKYGIPVTRHSDFNRQRAQAQPHNQQLFNMFKQMGTTIAGEAISGVGAIPALFEAIGEEVSGGDADFNNAIMEWGEQVQQYGRDKAPIYRERPNEAWDVKDLAWWTNNGVSIASSFGLMIPGLGIGYGVSKGLNAIGKLARVASIAGKGGKAATGIGKALASGAKFGQAASYYSRLGTSAFVMRNGENFKESMHTLNNTYNDIINMPSAELEALTNNSQDKKLQNMMNAGASRHDIAAHVASRAGWRNYALDAGNIVFDMVQLAPLFKGLRPNTRSLLNKSSLINVNKAVAKKAALTKGQALANNIAYYGLGGAGMETVTEGIEEMVNFIAAEEGMAYGKEILGATPDTDRLEKYLHDPMAWEQAFWGAIGGGFFAGGARAVSSIHNTINDPNSVTYDEARRNEMATRTNALGMAIEKIKKIEEGINPFSDPTNPTPIQSEEEAQELRNTVEDEVGDHIGLESSKYKNVNFAIEQLNSKEFRAQAKEDAGGEIDTDGILDRVRDRVLEAEETYKSYYGNIIVRDIPDHVKGVIVSEAFSTNRGIKANDRAVADLNKTISTKLADEATSDIRTAIDEEFKDDPDVSFTQSLNKAGLQFIKDDLIAARNSAKKRNDSLIVRRTTEAIEKIDKTLEEVKKNLNGEQLQERGITPDLIQDVGKKIGLEALSEGMANELANIITNTEEYAKGRAKDFKDAAEKQAEEKLAKVKDEVEAIPADDVEGLRAKKRQLLADSKRHEGIRTLVEGYAELIEQINTKEKDAIAEATRREAEGKPDLLPHEITNKNRNRDIEPSSDIDNTIDPDQDPVNNNEPSTGRPTAETPTEATENPEETIDETPTEIPIYDGKLSLYISSIVDIQTKLDENGVLYLTDEQAAIWDALTNQIKEGSELFIKYDEEQTLKKDQKAHRYNKRVAVYDDKGNRLFHIPTITEQFDQAFIVLRNMYYGTKNSWINRATYLIKSGKLNDELNNILKYKKGLSSGNGELIDEATAFLNKSALFQSIVNTNRKGKLDINSIAYAEAMLHIVNTTTKDIKPRDIFDTSKEDIVESMAKFATRMTSDVDNSMRIRNLLLGTPDLVMKANVYTKQQADDGSGKNAGSTIINMQDGEMQYTTLDNAVSNKPGNNKVALYVHSNAVYGQVQALNDEAGEEIYNIQYPINGIPYIGLKMATIDGSEELKFMRAQISNTRLTNAPAKVLDYNEKLANFIAHQVRNATNMVSLYNVLKHYLVLDKDIITDADGNTKVNPNVFFIRTVHKVEGKEYKFKVLFNPEIKSAVLLSQGGKTDLSQSRAEYGIRDFKERSAKFGIRRAVNYNDNRLNNKPFTDLVTDTNYDTYTEYLVDTGALLTEFGSVRDKDGNFITNASPDKRFNERGYDMKVYADISADKLEGMVVEKSEKPNVKERHTRLESYANALMNSNTNQYSMLFNMMDRLGIKFDSNIRIETTDENAYATYKDGTISLTKNFDGVDIENSIRLLAHESIHGAINGKITPEHTTRLSAIQDRLLNKMNDSTFADLFSESELNTLSTINNAIENNIEEVITYGLTNKTYAKALQSIAAVDSTTVTTSLVVKLLEIIKELIKSAFGATALDEVANILEDILLTKETTTETTAEVKPDDISDLDNDIMNDMLDNNAVAIDIIPTVPNAIDFLRTLNKEERAVARTMMTNGTLTFKCK